MARRNRNKIVAIDVSLDNDRTVGEFSDALNRAISEITREMILSNLPRFKNPNRKELKAHRNQIRNGL